MSKTLLLADDSVVIQKLVGLSFANEDVEIITTDNGDDAVIRARDVKPDVVLADVVMPGKSGYEVCEAIKQDPTLAHIPVLLLTGTFEAFDEARADAAGADGQITKPFEAQSLVERVSEVMNAPAAAAPPATEPALQTAQPVPAQASSADFDFFDANVSTLSADDSASQAPVPPATTDQTPAISSFDTPNGPATPDDLDVSGNIAASKDLDISEESLFGAPGDGATDELDTQGGGMALGESMTPDGSFGQRPASHTAGGMPDGTAPSTTPGIAPPGNAGIDHDATVVALPEPVTPLPPSRGDPLAAFEQDFGLNEMPAIPSEPVSPPAPADLDSAFDSVPSDPAATIVAGIDDNNASTSPSHDPSDLASDEPGETAGGYSGFGAGSQSGEPANSPFPADDEFEDLTIHAPSAAIDQAVASAPSPTAIEAVPHANEADPNATIVANLDVSLADSSPSMTPDAPNPLDLGPSNVSADELDFAFDVSEQAPADALDDGPGESFSSLMDISESQILVGPNSDSEELEPEAPPIDDAFAAGYDVSVSDLVTAAPPEAPEEQRISPPTAQPIPTATEAPTPAPITPDLPSPPLAAGEPVAIGQMSGIAANDDLEIATPAATTTDSDRISDLSPMIEQQIQETLEKVAWEAFSDLSETIVKQVIGRVEKIAWEVIPQMAETLVREEIRKMKGEND